MKRYQLDQRILDALRIKMYSVPELQKILKTRENSIRRAVRKMCTIGEIFCVEADTSKKLVYSICEDEIWSPCSAIRLREKLRERYANEVDFRRLKVFQVSIEKAYSRMYASKHKGRWNSTRTEDQTRVLNHLGVTIEYPYSEHTSCKLIFELALLSGLLYDYEHVLESRILRKISLGMYGLGIKGLSRTMTQTFL